ncbi:MULTISPECIES: AAA family ATPase [Streptomyces]|uniref:AAA family ATPase n=2 Tax=Streptomyces TaxID=1883 RepID=A0ABU4KA90_9ACTN|nr:AAA family ATPase [Streptomyces roseolus]MDX2294612.1 AAA family ATPase [Streptomyces roseolus]
MSTRHGHGLVPGRFCPPHAGHHDLVRTALGRCARVTVLVTGTAADPLPLADRVDWLREVHPEALVVGADAEDGLPAAVEAAVREPVDAVFTSAPYGDELARPLGAASVRVDPGRRTHPVTGAAVRADPAAHWELLAAPVRAALTRRVVVLGAERSGVTTLARALAAHYRRRGGVWARTRYVPDAGSAYAARRLAELRADRPGAGPADALLRSADFPVIAQDQAEREEEAARAGSPLLVCDTDAFAATIRHERLLGTASPGTGAVAARGRHHLWLLTDHRGVDPVDPAGSGDDGLRAWTTARLLAQLTHSGRRTVVVTGPHEERLATAVAAVDALLAEPLLERR